MHKPKTPRLTRREEEVLSWASVGKTAFETAQLLQISRDTVNFHIKNCLRKLDVENKTAAAAKATSLGLLRPTTGAPRIEPMALRALQFRIAAALAHPLKS